MEAFLQAYQDYVDERAYQNAINPPGVQEYMEELEVTIKNQSKKESSRKRKRREGKQKKQDGKILYHFYMEEFFRTGNQKFITKADRYEKYIEPTETAEFRTRILRFNADRLLRKLTRRKKSKLTAFVV